MSYAEFDPKYFVYALCEPQDKKIRYVGKSCKGLARPLEHFVPSALRKKSHKNSWIKSLLKRGEVPELIILQICRSADDVAEAEVNTIRLLREQGADLTNMTDGGTGGNTGGGVPKRPVVGRNLETGETKRFEFIHQTAGDGFSPTKVCAVAKGRRKSHKGWNFAYDD